MSIHNYIYKLTLSLFHTLDSLLSDFVGLYNPYGCSWQWRIGVFVWWKHPTWFLRRRLRNSMANNIVKEINNRYHHTTNIYIDNLLKNKRKREGEKKTLNIARQISKLRVFFFFSFFESAIYFNISWGRKSAFLNAVVATVWVV